MFPDARMHGCSFHFTQALWKHVKDIGLAVAYSSQPEVRQYLKVLFALQYLPVHEIEGAFNLHTADAPERLKPFVDYMQSTWITGRWKPEHWCMYKRAIRTNNDVEGWHNRLNRKAAQRGNLPMFALIGLLHKEATLINYQLEMVSEKKLRRYQRKQTKDKENNLSELWKALGRNELTIRDMLTLLVSSAEANAPE